MERDLHPGSHTGESLRVQQAAWEHLGPSSHLNRGLHPGTLTPPPRPAQQTNMAATDKINWVGSKGRIKRGRQETRRNSPCRPSLAQAS